MEPASPITVFYSYAHADELLQQQLETHLTMLRRQGLISEWYDRQILAGEEWEREIDTHLEMASIILLLVSPDFMASDYCYEIEVQHALERHNGNDALVIPVILRPVDWHDAPFGRLQCLPRNGKAVTEWSNQDAAFRDIAQGLRQAIQRRVSPPPLPHLSPVALQNRQRALKRVRKFWIDGVLEQSRRYTPLIPLRLYEQPDALPNPFLSLIQQSEQLARPLPADKRITEVYDDANGGLLILGEPGAGKTTLLLEIADDLLDRAERDKHRSIPFVFNLSPWAVKQYPLATWLVEELHEKYQVPYKIGQAWLDAKQIIPLLDGFDEVNPAQRSACLDAIDTFLKEHEPHALVVCSRSEEYRAERNRLSLDNAVLIKPLNGQEIDEYLLNAGEQLEALRIAIHQNQMLQELVTTPLMLSLLVLTYRGTSVENLSVELPLDTQIQRLLENYVQHMLQHGPVETHYTQAQMTHWLAWLAWQLVQHNQVEFYLERIQPDWLPPTRFYQRWYSIVVRLCIGLIACLITYLSIGIVTGLLFGTASGLSVGLVAGLVTGLLSGLVVGLVIGLLSQIKSQIQLVEAIDWSWRRLVKIKLLKERLLAAVSSSLTLGIIISLILLWTNRGQASFVQALIVVVLIPLIVVVATVITNGLTSGVSSKVQDEHSLTLPNRGIRHSTRISMLLGLIGSLIGAMVVIVILSLLLLLDQARFANVFLLLFGILLFGALTGTISGLTIGLHNGGIASIQHLVLRLFLRQANFIPPNYTQFLDNATRRILLRKVGGSYIFAHRLLLNYLASLHDLPDAQH